MEVVECGSEVGCGCGGMEKLYRLRSRGDISGGEMTNYAVDLEGDTRTCAHLYFRIRLKGCVDLLKI